MKTRKPTLRILFLLGTVLLLTPFAATASDHADPVVLKTVEAGINGLFAFTDGDDLALILTVRRRTSTNPPYDLEGFEYAIHIDTHSRVNWNNDENNHRYGGTVDNPEGISADATIRFRLDNNANFARGYPALEGFKTSTTRPSNETAGLFDDPFIFPRFRKSNVVAMIVTIPYSSFNGNPQHLLIWGTTTGKGLFGGTKQIDHVGRSGRSQAGRFDFLNTIPPDKQVQAIDAKRHGMQAWLMKRFAHLAMHVPGGGAPGDLFAYVIGLRRYDAFPDVMIYSRSRPDLYPNGRKPEDDIVGLLCAVGDCILQELASFESPPGEFPRVTVHKPAPSDKFPYLLKPLEARTPEPHSDRCFQIFLAVLALLVILFVVWRKVRLDKSEIPWVRPTS